MAREFPRLIYRGDGSRTNRLVVYNEAEMKAALKKGWREEKVPAKAEKSIEDEGA